MGLAATVSTVEGARNGLPAVACVCVIGFQRRGPQLDETAINLLADYWAPPSLNNQLTGGSLVRSPASPRVMPTAGLPVELRAG